METAARPIHIGILAILDGRALCGPDGRLRLSDIRRHIDGRIAAIPELRRVVFRPGRLAGRPLWVDDPAFRIDQHVGEVEAPPPGDEAALLALTEQLLARPLDRSRPLWRMWFVTGLDGGRVGVLVVLHHALADGLAAMRMVRALLEPPMSAADPGPRVAPVLEVPPPWGVLVRDNLRSMIESALQLARPATWRLLVSVVRYGWQGYRIAQRTPGTSLNGPVGSGRRLVRLELDRAVAKRVTHARGCGLNDVLLSVIAGGVRALLEARGESVERLRPRAGIAIALFSHGHGREAGNDIGSLLVPLPVHEADPVARLPLIAAEIARAKESPMVALEPVVRACLGRVGVVRRSMEQQRMVNLVETFLPGPPGPIEVLGAPVLDLLPIAPLNGNLGLSFVGLSYARRLTVTVRVDPGRFPDLDVLTAAMKRDWQALAESVAPDERSRAIVESPVGSAA